MLVKRTFQWTSYRVRCDRCGLRGIAMSELRKARRLAREAGWVRVEMISGKMDLCPDCKRQVAAFSPHLVGEAMRDVER